MTEFIEIANKEVVDMLCQLTLKQFIELCEQFYVDEEEDQDEKYDHQQQFNIIRGLCVEFKANNYKIKTEYNRRERREGRQYAVNNSLQRIWKPFRNALCNGLYIDIDQINSHPCIILALCKQNNIFCKQLEYYINNRNEVIEDIIETEALREHVPSNPRAYVKTMILKSINSSWIRKELNLNDKKRTIKNVFYKSFDSEMKQIQSQLTFIFKDELAIVKEKSKENVNGRLISYLGCKYEDILLERLFKHGIIPNVKMYDGFLIAKDNIPNVEKMIEKCNQLTADFNIKWDEKSIDDDLTPVLKSLDYSNSTEICIIENTTLNIAFELLKTHYDDKLALCNGVNYFKSERGWLHNDNMIKSQLLSEITRLDISIVKGKGKKAVITFIGDSLKESEDVVRWLMTHRPVNDDLINDLWEYTQNKLYFKNVYYDFKTHKTEPNDNNSFVSVNRDLNMKSDPELRAEIYRRIFNPIFTINDEKVDLERVQLRDCWLRKTARNMGGFIEDKEFSIMTGQRNCGKGVLADLLSNTFGNGYVVASNAENFMIKSTQDEEAKANSFMMDFEFCRIAITNEMSKGLSCKSVLDGNKIKKVHSGGDKIVGRRLYQETRTFRIQGVVYMFMNDEPTSNPSDAMDKCQVYDFNSKFIKQGEKKEFSNITYLDADEDIKSVFVRDKAVHNEFVLMLLDAFHNKAEYPARLKEENDNDNDDDITNTLKLFEFTGNIQDKVSISSIKDILAFNKVVFAWKKVKKMLIGKGAVEHRTTKGMMMVGLKKKEEEEEE